MSRLRFIWEVVWTIFLVAFSIFAIILVTGCATSELTPLEHRVRIEQRMRSCSNSGGIWVNPQGQIYAGRCDWRWQ